MRSERQRQRGSGPVLRIVCFSVWRALVPLLLPFSDTFTLDSVCSKIIVVSLTNGNYHRNTKHPAWYLTLASSLRYDSVN